MANDSLLNAGGSIAAVNAAGPGSTSAVATKHFYAKKFPGEKKDFPGEEAAGGKPHHPANAAQSAQAEAATNSEADPVREVLADPISARARADNPIAGGD